MITATLELISFLQALVQGFAAEGFCQQDQAGRAEDLTLVPRAQELREKSSWPQRSCSTQTQAGHLSAEEFKLHCQGVTTQTRQAERTQPVLLCAKAQCPAPMATAESCCSTSCAPANTELTSATTAMVGGSLQGHDTPSHRERVTKASQTIKTTCSQVSRKTTT